MLCRQCGISYRFVRWFSRLQGYPASLSGNFPIVKIFMIRLGAAAYAVTGYETGEFYRSRFVKAIDKLYRGMAFGR